MPSLSMNIQKSEHVVKDLKKLSSKSRAEASKRFFKTGKGQYGYGDAFVGITVPDQRLISQKYSELSLFEIKKLLQSKIHEHRLTGLLILVSQFNRADQTARARIVKFYLSQTKRINNWDLVDSSAGYILGKYLLDSNRKILYELVMSENIWERRIAIVATQAFIAESDFKDTLKLSQILFKDSHDLIHKATGWMLREVGKRSPLTLKKFLNTHAHQMPRTALRYAIERFPEVKRKSYLIRGKIIK
jgi:3-methyladenine DNA glycosylase AlkD